MSGFSSEERAAPFTLEYRVFLSECWRRVALPHSPAHSFRGLALPVVRAPAARARPLGPDAGGAPRAPQGRGRPGPTISYIQLSGGMAWIGVPLSHAGWTRP